MTLTVQPTRDELFEATMLRLRASPGAKRRIRTGRLVLAMAISAVAGLLVLTRGGGMLRPLLLVLGLGALAIALFPMLLRLTWARAARFDLASRPVAPEVKLALDDDALRSESPLGTSSTSWQAVLRLVRNERFLLLYLAPELPIVIPRRAVPDGAVAARVEQLTGKHFEDVA